MKMSELKELFDRRSELETKIRKIKKENGLFALEKELNKVIEDFRKIALSARVEELDKCRNSKFFIQIQTPKREIYSPLILSAIASPEDLEIILKEATIVVKTKFNKLIDEGRIPQSLAPKSIEMIDGDPQVWLKEL